MEKVVEVVVGVLVAIGFLVFALFLFVISICRRAESSTNTAIKKGLEDVDLGGETI